MHLKILLHSSGKDWRSLRLKGEIETCYHDNILVGGSVATGGAGSAHLVSRLPRTSKELKYLELMLITGYIALEFSLTRDHRK